jgi:4-amino-4-deoxy-L-arabinose transferase-like glycosyltransferase
MERKIMDPRTEARWIFIYLVLLFVVSFFVRYAHLSEFEFHDVETVTDAARRLPHHFFGYFDSGLFWHFGKETLRGQPVFPFQPPLLNYLLAGLIAILGESYFHAKLFFLGLASLSYVLLFLAVRTLAGTPTAVLSSLLTCFSFGLMTLNETIATENLFSFLLILMIFLAVYFPKISPKGFVLLFGAVSGLGILARTETALFVVILLGWLVWVHSPRFRIGYPLLCLTVTFLVLLPWGIRNHKEFGLRCFTALNGPYNFAVANSPLSIGGDDRRVYRVPKKTGSIWIDLNNPIERDYFLNGYRIGLSYILDDPARFAALVGKKMAISLDALSLGFFEKNFPAGLKGTRKTLDFFTPDDKSLWYPALVLLAIGGITLLREDTKRRILLPAVIVFKLGVIAGFFGHVRAILSILPFIFVLQSHGLLYFLRAIPLRPNPYGVGISGLLAGGAICLIQWADPAVLVTSRHLLHPSYVTYSAHRFGEALPETESALKRLEEVDGVIKDNLEISLAHLRIAEMSQKSGALTKTLDHLNLAIRFDPLSESAHRNLGTLHFHETGNYGEAARHLHTHLTLYPNDEEAEGLRMLLLQAKIKSRMNE